MPSTCVATNAPPNTVPITAIVCGLFIKAIDHPGVALILLLFLVLLLPFCIVKPSGISAKGITLFLFLLLQDMQAPLE